MTKEEKKKAAQVLNNLYLDCSTWDQWDTLDEDNWSAMVDGIETLADCLKIKLERKKV